MLHCQVMLNGSGYGEQSNSLITKEKQNGISKD